MEKRVLSEQSLYYGNVSMPKGFEINSLDFSKAIFDSLYQNKKFSFSRPWTLLNNYILDYLKLKFNYTVRNTDTWGSIYLPSEKSEPLLHIKPQDLKDSPDFTLLYGINTINCNIRIYYDDNRRKGKFEDVELKNNMFIMFPSTNLYCINNNQKNSLNFVQTILYEYL